MNVRVSLSFLAMVASVGCERLPIEDAELASESVVYGTDDRAELLALGDDQLRGVAQSALVALVPEANVMITDSGEVAFAAESLGEKRQLCKEERFSEQPSIADCTGVLLTDELVLTAGHCLTSNDDCEAHRFVFDYFYEDANTLHRSSAESVYACGELLLRVVPDEGPEQLDFAVVRLDRAVQGLRRPPDYDLGGGAVVPGALLTGVGFMGGLPAKVASNVTVIDARAESGDYFTALIDTIAGSSGMPLFDAANRVVGIHVRGMPDFIQSGSCQVSNRPASTDLRMSEDVQHVGSAFAKLCQEKGGDVSICSADSRRATVAGGGGCELARSQPHSNSVYGVLLMSLASLWYVRHRERLRF